MKNITLSTVILLISMFAFGQGPELVTNGDFETTPPPGEWYSGDGAGLNIVEIAGNRLNQKDVTTAGTDFSTNISQVIDLEDGKEYLLTFDAYTNAATNSRTIAAGLGQNANPFDALVETRTITTTPQTFSITATINYGNGVPDRVIFDIGGETGMVFIDNVSVTEILPIDDATLNDLKVDGVTLDGFDPNTTDYIVFTSSASSIPQITSVTTTSPLAGRVITQATDVFEDATVVVTAQDGTTTETYTIRIGLLTTNDIIQDFEPPPTYTGLTGDNGTTAIVVPSPGGITGNSLELESTVGGLDFQAGFFDQVSDFVVLTPENNAVQVDVYASQAFNLRLKLENGGPDIERTQSYDGNFLNTWQTLTYDFGAVDVTYERIVFFLNSNATNDGFLAPQDFTAYVDNVTLISLQTQQLYVYESGNWEPENPVGVSSSTSKILIKDGTADIADVLEGYNLEVQSGAKLEVNYPGVLKLTGDIINDGDIVFKSDTNGSGQFAEFNSNISGSGEITTERYIPAGEGPDNGNRAFRYLSSSITTTGSIFGNWQEGGNTIPNLGTHITGIQGDVANGYDPITGLDYTETGNPSMFGFNNDSGQWEAVGNTRMDDSTGPTPQIVLQDFNAGNPLTNFDGAAFEFDTDPNGDASLGLVAKLRSAPGGAPRQRVDVALFEPVDLTTDKTMQIQVYSENTITILLKVNGGPINAPASATALTVNGQTSWQTFTVTFNESLDNTDPADGVYNNFVIHYFWDTNTDDFPDVTPGPNEQIFFVNDILGTPVASSSPVANLEAGVPYAIMIRGDRNTDLTTNTPPTSNTVLRATGELKTGPVTKTFTQPDNAVMVGNPYQSVVDLKEVTYTGVLDDEFYVWDPRLGDHGNYVTVTTSTGVGDPSGSDANEFLQPGQAVFMLTDNSASHSITFNENDKATAEPQTEVFSTTNIPYLNMRLYTTARFNSGGLEHDAMGLRFHEQSNINQFRNAKKFSNSAETMAFEVGDDLASIQHAVLNSDQNLFPVYLASYQHQDYTFWFQLENLPEGTIAFLKDAYLDNSTEIEQGVNSISFQVDASIPESMNTARFSIEFYVETFSNEAFDTFAFQCYPNPTEDYLFINLGSYQALNTSVKVYDVTGRVLIQSNFTTNESIIQLDMSQLNAGFYLVELEEGNQKFTSKILKK